jgi:tetratricopeptide (TPR) repeat protein
MRYYYVKQRWADLGEIISKGFDVYFANDANKDDKGRLLQEIGKVRSDDQRLYKEVILPAISDTVVQICQRHPDRPEVLDALLFGKRGSGEGLDLLFELINKYPEIPTLRKYLTQRSGATYTFLKGLKDEEFVKVSEIILDSDKLNFSRAELYDIYRNFALTCSSLKRFDHAEKAQRKAIASFPEGKERKELMMLKYQLVVSLRNQAKVAELKEYIQQLLDDPTTEPVYRRIFEAELKKLK